MGGHQHQVGIEGKLQIQWHIGEVLGSYCD